MGRPHLSEARARLARSMASAEEILLSHPDLSSEESADAGEYLGGLTTFMTKFSMCASDVSRPCFVTQHDWFGHYGFGDVDNLYQIACIDGESDDRVTGERGSTTDFSIQLPDGIFAEGRFESVVSELSDRKIAPDTEGSVLAPNRHPGFPPLPGQPWSPICPR